MALMTVGRMPYANRSLESHRDLLTEAGGRIMAIENIDSDEAAADLGAAQERVENARDDLERARQNLLTQLTPWIPGDYLVVYGILLTALIGRYSSRRWRARAR